MIKKNLENIRIFEMIILRTIMYPIKLTDNEFRFRTNSELQEAIRKENIVKK